MRLQWELNQHSLQFLPLWAIYGSNKKKYWNWQTCVPTISVQTGSQMNCCLLRKEGNLSGNNRLCPWRIPSSNNTIICYLTWIEHQHLPIFFCNIMFHFTLWLKANVPLPHKIHVVLDWPLTTFCQLSDRFTFKCIIKKCKMGRVVGCAFVYWQ